MNERGIKASILFQERVLPSFSSFLPVMLVIPAAWLTLAPFHATFGIGIGIALAALITLLKVIRSPKIIVSKSHLAVGDAVIERKFIGKISQISKKDAFNERGPELNALAFTCLQSSVGELVKVEIVDRRDPTPYWLFSSRQGKTLVKALKN